MENDLKITQITAHFIEDAKEDCSLYGPYLRIKNNDKISWLYWGMYSEEEALKKWPSGLLRELESEFLATNGVMREQLELFNE